jgi:hypothetical protein
VATIPTTRANTPGHGRRLRILGAAAVAVIVVLSSVRSRQESVEQQIGEAVYGQDCLTKVSAGERVARRWPQASKAELIVCQTSESDEFANDVMDYAQFASATERSAALKSAPPDGSSCTIANAVVTHDEPLGAFQTMCANRGGTLRNPER